MKMTIASARRVGDPMPAFGAKQERPNHSVPPLIFTRLEGHDNLCPVKHLSAYMAITETDRRNLNSNVLFLTCVSPFRVAARFTVARWLTRVLVTRGFHEGRCGNMGGSKRCFY